MFTARRAAVSLTLAGLAMLPTVPAQAKPIPSPQWTTTHDAAARSLAAAVHRKAVIERAERASADESRATAASALVEQFRTAGFTAQAARIAFLTPRNI